MEKNQPDSPCLTCFYKDRGVMEDPCFPCLSEREFISGKAKKPFDQWVDQNRSIADIQAENRRLYEAMDEAYENDPELQKAVANLEKHLGLKPKPITSTYLRVFLGDAKHDPLIEFLAQNQIPYRESFRGIELQDVKGSPAWLTGLIPFIPQGDAFGIKTDTNLYLLNSENQMAILSKEDDLEETARSFPNFGTFRLPPRPKTA